jgi:hypothetical protein
VDEERERKGERERDRLNKEIVALEEENWANY